MRTTIHNTPENSMKLEVFESIPRYGFNTMEKDDEFSQGKYDFGARIYDARLGKWLAIDPLVALYPDKSPYTFAGNSPLVFIDKDGEFIKPATKKSQIDLEASWTSIFTLEDGTSPMAEILKSSLNNLGSYGQVTSITGGATSGSPINTKSRSYKREFKKLSPEQQRLATDYVAMINNDTETFFLSATDKTKMPKFNSESMQRQYGGQDLQQVLEDNGGGFTFYDKSTRFKAGSPARVMIVVNISMLQNIKVTIGTEEKGKGTGAVSSDEVIAHEMLGHGLSYLNGVKGIGNDLKAIEVGNIVRKLEGKDKDHMRNGNDHHDPPKPPSGDKGSETPDSTKTIDK